MSAPTVAVRLLPHAIGLPAYATAGAAGADLAAALAEGARLSIPPGGRMLVPTGLILAIPDGYEGQVRPRSGLALRQGLTVLNAPGTIDSDYRGEVSVLLVNLGDAPVAIARGDRIAQLVIAPAPQAVFAPTATTDGTRRGAGGFGSTGVSSHAAPQGDAPAQQDTPAHGDTPAPQQQPVRPIPPGGDQESQ